MSVKKCLPLVRTADDFRVLSDWLRLLVLFMSNDSARCAWLVDGKSTQLKQYKPSCAFEYDKIWLTTHDYSILASPTPSSVTARESWPSIMTQVSVCVWGGCVYAYMLACDSE